MFKLFSDNDARAAGKENVHWCYAHGELERILGYDIVCEETGLGELPLGEYDVEFYGEDNKKYDCRAFIWQSDIRRGLFVLKTDTKSMEYAKEKFTKRASII